MSLETELIRKLLDSSLSPSKRSAALKVLSEYLEETYILDLPISKEVLAALSKIAKKAGEDAGLRKTATRLLKKYGP